MRCCSFTQFTFHLLVSNISFLIHSVLNKITPEKFDRLMEQLLVRFIRGWRLSMPPLTSLSSPNRSWGLTVRMR